VFVSITHRISQRGVLLPLPSKTVSGRERIHDRGTGLHVGFLSPEEAGSLPAAALIVCFELLQKRSN